MQAEITMPPTPPQSISKAPVRWYLCFAQVVLPICAIAAFALGRYAHTAGIADADRLRDETTSEGRAMTIKAGLDWPIEEPRQPFHGITEAPKFEFAKLVYKPGESPEEYKKRLDEATARETAAFQAAIEERKRKREAADREYEAKLETIRPIRAFERRGHDAAQARREAAEGYRRAGNRWALWIVIAWGAALTPLAYRLLVRPMLVVGVKAGSAAGRAVRQEAADIATDARKDG